MPNPPTSRDAGLALAPLVCAGCAEPFTAREATAKAIDEVGQTFYRCPACDSWEPGSPPC